MTDVVSSDFATMPTHSECYYTMWKDATTMIAVLIFIIINN